MGSFHVIAPPRRQPKPQLRWRKRKRPSGLAGFRAESGGSELRYGSAKVGQASWSASDRKWYWVAGWDLRDRVPHHNSVWDKTTLCDTEAQAKWDCEAYGRDHLKIKPAASPRPGSADAEGRGRG